MWRTMLGGARPTTAASSTVASRLASSLMRNVATAACPFHGLRSLHTSSAALIVGGTSRRRVRTSPRKPVADPLSALRAAQAAEEAADAEAAEAALQGQAYRRPHLRRKGKAFEARRTALAQADESAAEKDMRKLEAELTPAERRRLDELEKGDAARFGIDAEELNSKASASSRKPKRMSKKQAAALHAQQVEESVRDGKSLTDTPASNEGPISAPLVAHVEAQLRRLDSVGPGRSSLAGSLGMGGGASGIGFDSIDLSRGSIAEDEVFETVRASAAMRKMAEAARKGDSQKRMALQRIERVTERSKEIIGRVLLEESVRIGAAQQHQQQQPPSTPKRPRAQTPKGKAAPAAASRDVSQLIDLRTTPTFRIHQVRYSTDLAWASVMWTLGKDGYDYSEDPEQQYSEYDEPRKPSKPSTSSLPNWFVTKRRVSRTLEHVVKGLRYTLGQELDIRYTPSIKFTYDDLHEAQQTRERMERDQEEEQHRELKQLMQMEEDEEAAAAAERGDPSKALAAAKSRLLGRGGGNDQGWASMLDAGDSFMSPEEVAKDEAMEASYDEGRRWFLPKKKIASLVHREKLKQKTRDAYAKKKELLAKARALTKGVSLAPLPEIETPNTTDPAVLQTHLRAVMARLVRSKDAAKPETLAELRTTRAQITQLQQVQALARKASLNPVEDLRAKHHKDEMPHYPKDWRKMKDVYWKRTDRGKR